MKGYVNNMKNDEINKLHNYLLDILKEFQRICNKNNLTYFAIAGTMLGAVRHDGFIPWDDDLDVGMPIKDFLLLRKFIEKDIKQPYVFIDTLNKKRNIHYFYKIENEKTTFIEEENVKFKKGIWIDILPFSGTPDNNISLYIFLKKLYFYKKLDLYRNMNYNDCKNIKQKILKIISFPFTIGKKNNYYVTKFENLMNKYDFKKSKKIFYAWRLSFSYKKTIKYSVFDSKIFNSFISHKFENTSIMLPVRYDLYLKKCYGDYMKLPPIEKRKCHKPFLLSFDKSYKEI